MKLLFQLIFLIICIYTITLGDIPTKLKSSNVYDENHLLNPAEIQLFDNLSQELYSKTGIQLFCILLNDTRKIKASEYAKMVAKNWSEENASVTIFIAQKEHWKTVIATDTTLFNESYLANIQQKTLLPALKTGEYAKGILSLAWAISKKASTAKNVTLNLNENNFIDTPNKISSISILFIMFVAFFLLMAKFSGNKGKNLLFGGIIKKRNKKDENTFTGGFGCMRNGFNSGFGNNNLR